MPTTSRASPCPSNLVGCSPSLLFAPCQRGLPFLNCSNPFLFQYIDQSWHPHPLLFRFVFVLSTLTLHFVFFKLFQYSVPPSDSGIRCYEFRFPSLRPDGLDSFSFQALFHIEMDLILWFFSGFCARGSKSLDGFSLLPSPTFGYFHCTYVLRGAVSSFSFRRGPLPPSRSWRFSLSPPLMTLGFSTFTSRNNSSFPIQSRELG